MDSKKSSSSHVKPAWDPAVLIADRLKLRRKSVSNVINLLEDGATVPFIARYRKEQTDNMEPEHIREVASGLEELRDVEKKIQTVHSSVEKMGKMTNILETSLKFSTSLLEVDALYAPFKPGHAGTYAERARALGLEPLTLSLLEGKKVNTAAAVNFKEKGLSSVGDVEKGIKHIIADIVSKDKDVLDHSKQICQIAPVLLESSRVKEKQEKKETSKSKSKVKFEKETSSSKFEQYFDFKVLVKFAKPHQVLAVNRGEELKILGAKIEIPDSVKNQIITFTQQKYLKPIRFPEASNMIQAAIMDSYDRLIKPAMCRRIRSDLTKNAEKASISVFMSNLKRLLLAPPFKGKTVLGIDPGFRNGCKYAVISSTGQVLDTGVAYLHDVKVNKHEEQNKLASLVQKHRCGTITIGNGVACRETEQTIAQMIKSKCFRPVDVVYTIVDECGASIYSVSKEATTELPDLDPTLRGAVSIARRLQDPLAEMVKIEPQHLGVGMYQHDVNKTKLQTALDSVVEECVSFVGVDLNTCSQCLLKHVAGLNSTKSKNIIEWRNKNGLFRSRQQLNLVKGLGPKGFEQCAGFVRVLQHGDVFEDMKTDDQPIVETEGRKRKAKSAGTTKAKKAKKEISMEWNPLDATPIHPESYELTNRLVRQLSVDLSHLGTERFIQAVKKNFSNGYIEKFCEESNAGLATVKLIVETLSRPISYDFRENFQKPLFKQDVMSISSLHYGTEVTGRVTNVTHFGAFVDIGVGENGLIHSSKMGRWGQLGVGDHVEVRVDSVDLDRKRIGLRLLQVL